MDINGKYIWIIGASSGIGHALSIELSKHGATLALSARREEELTALKNELDGDGHLVLPLDVGNYDDVSTAFQTITSTFPTLDSAIFMAAIYSPHDGLPKDISFIQNMLTVNIGGAYNMLQDIIPYFEQKGSGQIALCGSVAGYRGLPNGQPYCSTKAAIINLAETLRIELLPKNIDVKIINPGFVKTPLTDKNKFPMPMMVTADQAAKDIANGLTKKSFEIHFPKKFTTIMKFLEFLPRPFYFWLIHNATKGKL